MPNWPSRNSTSSSESGCGSPRTSAMPPPTWVTTPTSRGRRRTVVGQRLATAAVVWSTSDFSMASPPGVGAAARLSSRRCSKSRSTRRSSSSVSIPAPAVRCRRPAVAADEPTSRRRCSRTASPSIARTRRPDRRWWPAPPARPPRPCRRRRPVEVGEAPAERPGLARSRLVSASSARAWRVVSVTDSARRRTMDFRVSSHSCSSSARQRSRCRSTSARASCRRSRRSASASSRACSRSCRR